MSILYALMMLHIRYNEWWKFPSFMSGPFELPFFNSRVYATANLAMRMPVPFLQLILRAQSGT